MSLLGRFWMKAANDCIEDDPGPTRRRIGAISLQTRNCGVAIVEEAEDAMLTVIPLEGGDTAAFVMACRASPNQQATGLIHVLTPAGCRTLAGALTRMADRIGT